jgi:hypothetical protein
MDPKRLDLIIDRELRSALSVTPSADFTARVHRRLADQPRPALFRWRWFALVGAPVAAMVVAIGVVLMRPALPPALPDIRTFVPSAPVPVAMLRIPLPAQAPAPKAAKWVTIRRAQNAVGHEVETIVPPGQAEAIRLFARSLSEMSVSSRQLPRVVEIFEGELPQVPSYNEKRDEQ